MLMGWGLFDVVEGLVDHHLLGRPLDPLLASPVRIFVLGENVWRAEQEWPLARTQYTAFWPSTSK